MLLTLVLGVHGGEWVTAKGYGPGVSVCVAVSHWLGLRLFPSWALFLLIYQCWAQVGVRGAVSCALSSQSSCGGWGRSAGGGLTDAGSCLGLFSSLGPTLSGQALPMLLSESISILGVHALPLIGLSLC